MYIVVSKENQPKTQLEVLYCEFVVYMFKYSSYVESRPHRLFPCMRQWQPQ